MKNAGSKVRGVINALAVISMAMMIFSPVQAKRTSRIPNVATNDAAVPDWGEIASTWNAAGNGLVPFKAFMSGSAAFTSPTTVEFQNTGLATHLGRFVASGVAVLDASTGSCPGGPNVPNVHTETLTAANGDQLVIQMVNVACPTGPYTFRGTGHWTVLSGTGRFQNATGQGTNEGHVDFESSTFVMVLTGTLSRQ